MIHYFNQTSYAYISPETLIALLQLDLTCEGIVHQRAIFERCSKITKILYILLNIKQQPFELSEMYEKLKETVIVSFINYELNEIINFLQMIFCEKLGFFHIYNIENEFGLVQQDEEINELQLTEISQLVQPIFIEIIDLKPYYQKMLQESRKNSIENQSINDFLNSCSSLFDNSGSIISPFNEENADIQNAINECQSLKNQLNIEKTTQKRKIEEMERALVKTRNNCHRLNERIEIAILEDKKIKISIREKQKQLIELQSQIDKSK